MHSDAELEHKPKSNWRYVLPIVLVLVIVVLGAYALSVQRPTERALLATGLPTYDLSLGTVTPVPTWEPETLTAVQNWIESQTPYPPATLTAFFATEFANTPNSTPQVFWLDGFNSATPSPTMTFIPTMVPPTVTATSTLIPPSPTVTATPGIPTPGPVIGQPINIYGDHVDPRKGLNLRCDHSLYGTCNYGYLLPYCGYIDDDRDCNPVFDSVVLTKIVYVDGGWWHRQDTGWWGQWADGWLAMCLEMRDYDFVDKGCGQAVEFFWLAEATFTVGENGECISGCTSATPAP